MDSKRTYVYNVVLRENDVCPQGELLTDKELERMKLHNCRRDWPRTAKHMLRVVISALVYDLEQ